MHIRQKVRDIKVGNPSVREPKTVRAAEKQIAQLEERSTSLNSEIHPLGLGRIQEARWFKRKHVQMEQISRKIAKLQKYLQKLRKLDIRRTIDKTRKRVVKRKRNGVHSKKTG